MRTTLSPKAVILLCKKLDILLRSGVSLHQALILLTQDAPDNSGLRSVLTALEAGQPFFPSFQAILPTSIPLYVSPVDSLPNLQCFLSRLEKYYSDRITLLNELKAKLNYPIILTVSLIGILISIFGVILPMYAQFYAGLGMKLPGVILFALQFKKFITGVQGALCLVLIALAGVFFYSPIKNKIRFWLFPAQVADILSLISLFLESGLSLKQSIMAISLPEDHGYFLAYQAFQADCLETGQFQKSFTRYFSISAFESELLAISEKGASLKEGLMTCATQISERLYEKTQKQIAMVQPILLFVLAFAIGGCIYATFTPIISSISQL